MTSWQRPTTFDTSSPDTKTTQVPFYFYVPGIGDLALAKSKEKPDYATVVYKKDGTSPDRCCTIIFDTSTCQVRISELESQQAHTIRERLQSIISRLMRSVLKVLCVSLGCAYSFGFVSTVIDVTLTAFLRVKGISTRPLPYRLAYGFVWGYFSGALLRPACNQAKAMLSPMLNRIGRCSSYESLRAGYSPFFWTEDLPEFLGFMISTPICEYYRSKLGLMKGAVRSIFGMGIGSTTGEIARMMNSTWRECTAAEVVRDELTHRLQMKEEVGREIEVHHDASMGIIIGVSVVVGIIFWYTIEKVIGKGLDTDILGCTATLAVMMIFYKVHCRCMRGEPSAFVCRELRALAAKRHKRGSAESFVTQSDIDAMKKCASCSRRDIGSTFSDDLAGCL